MKASFAPILFVGLVMFAAASLAQQVATSPFPPPPSPPKNSEVTFPIMQAMAKCVAFQNDEYLDGLLKSAPLSKASSEWTISLMTSDNPCVKDAKNKVLSLGNVGRVPFVIGDYYKIRGLIFASLYTRDFQENKGKLRHQLRVNLPVWTTEDDEKSQKRNFDILYCVALRKPKLVLQYIETSEWSHEDVMRSNEAIAPEIGKCLNSNEPYKVYPALMRTLSAEALYRASINSAEAHH